MNCKFPILWAVCMTAVMMSCNHKASSGDSVTGSDGEGRDSVSQADAMVRDDGESPVWHYGNHTYTMRGNLTADKYQRDATGEVTFTNIPTDYEEFEALYKTFLGHTPHGVAAMMPMAMELFARNPEVGTRCIQLICYKSNVSAVIPRLKDKLRASPGDSYGQRYLPAAVLKGATAENAYTPTKPYAVEMTASVNQHQQLKIAGSGTVMYIYITGGGWDTRQRGVELILEPGHTLYQVFNCPSLYVGCRQIEGTWKGLE